MKLTLLLLNFFFCFSIYGSEYGSDDKIYVKNSTGKTISVYLSSKFTGAECLRVQPNDTGVVELSRAQFKCDHFGIKFSDSGAVIYMKKFSVGKTYEIKGKITIEEVNI